MATMGMSEVHVLRPLQNFQISYMQDLPSTWAQTVPNIPSQHKSDKFTIYPETYWLRAGGAPRAPNTEAARVDYHLTYGQFNAQNIEAEYALDDMIRANMDSEFMADTASVKIVTRNLLMAREQLASGRFLQTGVWGTDFQPNSDGNGYWDADNSNPIRDVRELKRLILGRTGIECNVLILDQDVIDALMDCQAIVYRFNFTGTGGVLDIDKLAQVFGVEKIVANRSIIDTTPLPGSNPGFMSSGQFLLAHTTPGASLTDPTAFACFNWTGYAAAGQLGNTVERYRREEIRSTMYRSAFACDYQITAPALGVYGYNVLTPKSSTPATTTPAGTSASTASTSSSAPSTSSTSSSAPSASSTSSSAPSTGSSSSAS